MAQRREVFDSLEFIWAGILSELSTTKVTQIKASSRVANLVRCLYSNPFALKRSCLKMIR